MDRLKTTLAAAGLAVTAACAPTVDANGNYEIIICKTGDKVTQLLSSNGTDAPFDDTVIREITREENHPSCENGGDNDRGGGNTGGGNTGGGNDEV